MQEKKWVNVLIQKDRMKELSLAKMERFSREEIIEFEASLRAKDMFRLAKILIEQLGREKAKEIYEREIYSIYNKQGREAAEKLGNPSDLDTYLNVWAVEAMASIPAVQPPIITERTENMVRWGVTHCYYGDAYRKIGDPVTFEVIKSRCCHDIAWTHGFNPKIRIERTKFLLDGDDMCEWKCVLEQSE